MAPGLPFKIHGHSQRATLCFFYFSSSITSAFFPDRCCEVRLRGFGNTTVGRGKHCKRGNHLKKELALKTRLVIAFVMIIIYKQSSTIIHPSVWQMEWSLLASNGHNILSTTHFKRMQVLGKKISATLSQVLLKWTSLVQLCNTYLTWTQSFATTKINAELWLAM